MSDTCHGAHECQSPELQQLPVVCKQRHARMMQHMRSGTCRGPTAQLSKLAGSELTALHLPELPRLGL